MARTTQTLAEKAQVKTGARAVVVLTVTTDERGRAVVTPEWAGSTPDGIRAVLLTAIKLQKLARQAEAARA